MKFNYENESFQIIDYKYDIECLDLKYEEREELKSKILEKYNSLINKLGGDENDFEFISVAILDNSCRVFIAEEYESTDECTKVLDLINNAVNEMEEIIEEFISEVDECA